MTEIAKRKATATKPRPKNDAELKRYLMDTFAVTLPDTVVEAGHSTPFRAFADAYFARSGVAVWKASRGFGGKSFLLSLLGAVEAETLGAEITVLGGSGEQATRVQEYMGQWFQRLGYDSNKRETTLPNGGRTRALMASQKSIRGPHPQKLRCDEVDDMSLTLLDAAMGQPMSKPGIAKQTVFSGTHQYPDGTMTEILKRAKANGWPVYEWSWRETSAPGGWLTAAEIESKRAEVTAAMWAAEYDLQEPSAEGRAIVTEKVGAMFKHSLGVFEGRAGERIEIEPPMRDGSYATGADWAKSKDWSVIWTLRVDCRPMRLVAFERFGREPWPVMIAKFNDRVSRYEGRAAHDATGIGGVVDDYLTVGADAVTLVGQRRADIFTRYIAGIESGVIEAPMIHYADGEHRYVTNDDLRGAGHPPDTFVAGALAYDAANAGSIFG